MARRLSLCETWAWYKEVLVDIGSSCPISQLSTRPRSEGSGGCRSPKPMGTFVELHLLVSLLGVHSEVHMDIMTMGSGRKRKRASESERERERVFHWQLALPSPFIPVLVLELIICSRLHRHCENDTNMIWKGIRSSRPHVDHPGYCFGIAACKAKTSQMIEENDWRWLKCTLWRYRFWGFTISLYRLDDSNEIVPLT